MKSFGENLRNARTWAHLSQQELARKMGTTQQRVSEWENNKIEPTLYNVIKMVKILNITF